MLIDLIWRTTVTWYAGNVACKVVRFMQAVVTYGSTYVLVALSIDRYDAITRPMNFTGSCEFTLMLYNYAVHGAVLFKFAVHQKINIFIIGKLPTRIIYYFDIDSHTNSILPN